METFRKFGFDKPLAFAVLALVVIGIVMVFSSSAVLAAEKYKQPFRFFIHQILGAGAGLVLAAAILTVKKPFYQNALLVNGLLAGTGLLLLACFLMPSIANTNRWVQLFGVRFQPSELAKVSLVLFFSYYCETRRDKLHEGKTVFSALGILLVFVVLVMLEPDYSTAILLAALSGAILFLGGVKARYFLAIGGVLAVLFAVYLFQARYRIDRIQAFLTPGEDPLGKSFQVSQSKLAVGSGGLLGVSLGESTQKLYFLPCAHTDFIFAILGEEVGLLGTTVTLSLFLIILWRGFSIAVRTQSPSQKLIAAGLTLGIAAQALINITIVLGIGPVTGIPLPFISFGRSALVCNLLAAGILLNISQRKEDNGIRI